MKNPLVTFRDKEKYRYKEAYCLIEYRNGTTKEVLWNSRDGDVPFTIYDRTGTQQLTRVKGTEKRDTQHILLKGERYFASMTKERALYLTAKTIEGRWNHPKYPLSEAYENKKVARYLLFKSLYNDGKAFTILKHGKDVTKYLTKQFRNFIDSTSPA